MKTILIDAVNTFVIKNHGIFKEMLDLLEQYPNKKIIVTNAEDNEIKIFGLDKMPYEVFTLKHDPNKTDPKYFDILLNKYGLKAEDVLYFEHNQDAVKSAKMAGINVFHYNHEKMDLTELKKFLDKSIS